MALRYDFDQKYGTRGKGDVLLLLGRVHDDLGFFGLVAVKGHGNLKDIVNVVFLDAASEIAQL